MLLWSSCYKDWVCPQNKTSSLNGIHRIKGLLEMVTRRQGGGASSIISRSRQLPGHLFCYHCYAIIRPTTYVRRSQNKFYRVILNMKRRPLRSTGAPHNTARLKYLSVDRILRDSWANNCFEPGGCSY